MGQYSSYAERNLANKVSKIERDILELKAIQNYNPQQINYTYQSNVLTINSYRIAPDSPYDTHQGILASLIFTSWFPNVLPRASFEFTGDCVLVNIRTEVMSQNQIRVIIYLLDDLIPLSPPHNFTAFCSVRSNTSGVLKLEKTYVRPK